MNCHWLGVFSLTLAILLNLGWAVLGAQGQSSNWTALLEEGEKFRRQANYVEAEKLLLSALKAIDADPEIDDEDLRKVLILAPLAELMTRQFKFSDSESLYRRALSICETRYGPDDRNVAAILAHLASLYYNKQRRYTEAESFFVRAIAISEKIYSGL